MIELIRVVASTFILYIKSALDFNILGFNVFFLFSSFLMLSMIFYLFWRFK